MSSRVSRERRGDPVGDWLRMGPETASSELVERTLAPIPRMRQRRAWRITWERFRSPAIGALAGAVAVAALAIGVGMIGRGPSIGGEPSPTPSLPTFTLEITGGPGHGTYVADMASSLNICPQASDGSWRLLYAGGTPYVSLDLLVGARAGQPGGENHVAADVSAGQGYFRFDPAQLRGGDRPGRSTAAVTVTTTDSSATFDITATTPDRTGGVTPDESSMDLGPIQVHLIATCPR